MVVLEDFVGCAMYQSDSREYQQTAMAPDNSTSAPSTRCSRERTVLCVVCNYQRIRLLVRCYVDKTRLTISYVYLDLRPYRFGDFLYAVSTCKYVVFEHTSIVVPMFPPQLDRKLSHLLRQQKRQDLGLGSA
jgi:hypothetical protein